MALGSGCSLTALKRIYEAVASGKNMRSMYAYMASFLQSVMFFVRSISVKVTKNHYRSSSVLMSGAVVIAVVAFSANGFGGGGKNAMAAPEP